jgi:hypothetical protein
MHGRLTGAAVPVGRCKVAKSTLWPRSSFGLPNGWIASDNTAIRPTVLPTFNAARFKEMLLTSGTTHVCLSLFLILYKRTFLRD